MNFPTTTPQWRPFHPLFILAFVGAIFFSACEDNLDITETTTETEDPTELETTRLTGIVKDIDGQPISNATLSFYHQGEEYDRTTDASGRYDISFPKDGNRVNMKADASTYLETVKVLDLTESSIKKDIVLAKPSEIPYDVSTSASILDSLYLLTGRLLMANGDPVERTFVSIINFRGDDDLYTFTDSLGYFELAAEPFSDKFFMALRAFPCPGIWTINSSLTVVDQDVDFGTITTNFEASDEMMLTGIVRDCNGNPITNGNVVVNGQGRVSSYVYSYFVSDGRYEIPLPLCDPVGCYDITVTSPNVSGKIEEFCLPYNPINLQRDFELCGVTVSNELEGELRLKIGQDSVIYIYGAAASTANGWTVSSTDDSQDRKLTFDIDGSGTGTQNVSQFRVFQGPDIYEEADANSISVTITSANNRLQGTINGTIVQPNSNRRISLSGTINCVIK